MHDLNLMRREAQTFTNKQPNLNLRNTQRTKRLSFHVDNEQVELAIGSEFWKPNMNRCQISNRMENKRFFEWAVTTAESCHPKAREGIYDEKISLSRATIFGWGGVQPIDYAFNGAETEKCSHQIMSVSTNKHSLQTSRQSSQFEAQDICGYLLHNVRPW